MFKSTINALQRHKDKPVKGLKFKRVLKMINNPNEKVKSNIMFHSFFNKYANHPIPIKALAEDNNDDKISLFEELDEEDTELIKKNGFLLSMIQNELPLSKLFSKDKSNHVYSLDNDLIQILNKAKTNKDENIVSHAKMKPFTQDYKLDKEKYLSEYKKLLALKKVSKNAYKNVYTFHPDNVETIKEGESENNENLVSNNTNDLSESESKESESTIGVDKLVYKNLGKSKRAEIALRRFSKKHNLNMDDKAVLETIRPASKFNFQNNYFKIKDKDILIPRLKTKKYGIVYCWEISH